jgi:hypothetical protein
VGDPGIDVSPDALAASFVELISADGESGGVLMVVSGMKMILSMVDPLHWMYG